MHAVLPTRQRQIPCMEAGSIYVPPRSGPRRMRILRSNRREKWQYAWIEAHGRRTHRDSEAGGEWRRNGGTLPSTRYQRTDFVPVEGQVGRAGRQRQPQAPSAREREPEAQERGGRTDVGQPRLERKSCKKCIIRRPIARGRNRNQSAKMYSAARGASPCHDEKSARPVPYYQVRFL